MLITWTCFWIPKCRSHSPASAWDPTSFVCSVRHVQVSFRMHATCPDMVVISKFRKSNHPMDFRKTKIAQRKMWFWGFGIAPLSNVFAFHNYIINTIFVVNYNNTHVFYKSTLLSLPALVSADRVVHSTVHIIKNWRMATFSPWVFSLSFHHQNVPIKLFCGLYCNAVQS